MNIEVLKINNISAGYGSTTVINSFSFAINQEKYSQLLEEMGLEKVLYLNQSWGLFQ
jgi:hypothetical protein